MFYYLQLADTYDVVVNCTGFYARDLCNDATVEPVRGQVMRVSIVYTTFNVNTIGL